MLFLRNFSRTFPVASKINPLTVALFAILAAFGAPGCSRGGRPSDLGSPASFVVLRPSENGRFTRLHSTDAVSSPVFQSLRSGFGLEVIRVVHATKRYLAQTHKGPGPVPAGLEYPIILVLESNRKVETASHHPAQSGFLLGQMFGDLTFDGVPWVPLALGLDAAAIENDAARVQYLAGALGRHAAELAASSGAIGRFPVPDVLVQGYGLAMEVVARQWRPGGKRSKRIPSNAGTPGQRALFADIRNNIFARGSDPHKAVSARLQLKSPEVAAAFFLQNGGKSEHRGQGEADRLLRTLHCAVEAVCRGSTALGF